MRLAAVLCTMLCVACGSSSTASASRITPSPSAQPAASESHGQQGLVVVDGLAEFAMPNPSSPGSFCTGCGTSSISGIVAGGDGNVWVADSGRDAVYRVSPDGAMAEIGLPGSPVGDERMSRGPDGSVWAVADGDGSVQWIVHVSLAGQVEKFQVPPLANGYSAGADSIAVAADGTVWVTEFFASAILRRAPDGSFTSYATPIPDSAPAAMTIGPDGNAWFVERPLHRETLARITPAGTISEYTFWTGADSAGSTYVIVGPDRNFWLTAPNEIERATTGGDITSFALPKGAAAGELAAGPDGRIWFTDPGLNAVGKMSLGGDVREYALPRSAAQPSGIAAGADGRMWFAESGVSLIGRLGVEVPVIALSATSLVFGPGSGAQSVTATNTGDGALKMSSVQIAGADDAAFVISRDTCSGIEVPPGASCSATVALAGAAASALRGATLRFIDNANARPQAVALTAGLPSCRLPLTIQPDVADQVGPVTAAWLDSSSGSVTSDPAGQLNWDAARQLRVSTTRPFLYGPGPTTYDGPAKRWVPVAPQEIAPDGGSYVFISGTLGHPALHLVDVSTGTERVVALPGWSGVFWASVMAYSTEGVYVVKDADNVGALPGLWLVDPNTGAMKQLLSTGVVQAVGGGAAWLAAVDPRDPEPLRPPSGGTAPNEVVRRDLTTGQTDTWFYRPGRSVSASLFEGGLVAAVAGPVGAESTWVVNGPDLAQQVIDAQTGDPILDLGSIAVADGSLLMRGDRGVYVWTARTGALLLSSTGGSPAGPCQS